MVDAGAREPVMEEQEKSDQLPQVQPDNRSVGNRPYAAPGVAAEHETGVLYQGEFETPSDGTAQAVRLHARALARTGVPVLLRSFSGTVVNPQGVVESVHVAGLPKEVETEVGDLTKTSIGRLQASVKHLVVRNAEHLRQAIVPRGAVVSDPDDLDGQIRMRDALYAKTIVYSVWERDSIDEAVARQLARAGQCWVPSEHNAKLLVARGVPGEKVHVVPHPFTDDDLIHQCTQRPAKAHGGQKRFYSIGRWEPRKGFALLIAAFLKAFAPGDNATLTIKWSGSGMWPQYLTPDDALHVARTSFGATNGWDEESAKRAVKLIPGRLPRSQIVGLHLQNNIYVSSSHGEAFNLSAFDAKLAGNRLVHVPWGGTADFAGADDVAVPYEMYPVHPSYRWESDAQWASFEVEHMARALRSAAELERFRENFHRDPKLDVFSMAAVGQKMRSLVQKLVPEKKLAL